MLHRTSLSGGPVPEMERPWNSREKTNRNKAAVCSSPTLLQVYPGRTRHVVLSHPSVSTLPMSHSSKKLSRTSGFCFQTKKSWESKGTQWHPPPHWGRTPSFSWKNWKNSPPETCSDMLNDHKTGGWILEAVPFPRWHVPEGIGEWSWNKIKNEFIFKKNKCRYYEIIDNTHEKKQL